MRQLVLIGIAAGFFSALFGVGGGIVVVPLLLLSGRWQERPAMATSLAAIGIIARRRLDLVRLPRRAEARRRGARRHSPPQPARSRGTALQQRLANRTLSLLFALLLAGIGVKLLI